MYIAVFTSISECLEDAGVVENWVVIVVRVGEVAVNCIVARGGDGEWILR